MEAVRASGLPLYCVNDAYRLAPWGVLYACDYRWWLDHEAASRHVTERWTCDEKAAKAFPSLRWIKGWPRPGLGTDCLHYGDNSGYQAINLAFVHGFRRLYLLGFDLGHDGSKAHFFGSHAGRCRDNPRYGDFIRNFNLMQPENHGLDVINCSRRTALTCFPRRDLAECLEPAA